MCRRAAARINCTFSAATSHYSSAPSITIYHPISVSPIFSAKWPTTICRTRRSRRCARRQKRRRRPYWKRSIVISQNTTATPIRPRKAAAASTPAWAFFILKEMWTRRSDMTGLRVKLSTLVLVLLAGLAACTGDGTQTAGGGIGGTGVSQGPITGFGSIFVNGVEFDTSSATILRGGATVAQNDLRIGMVVAVDGSIHATYIAVKTRDTEAELKSTVSNVNGNVLSLGSQQDKNDNTSLSG